MGKEQKNEGKKEVNKEIKLLEEYLNQYYTCMQNKRNLECRLKSIQYDMNAPIGGTGYKMLNGSTNASGTGPGAASFVYHMAEIETRIVEQKAESGKALLKVMDILDFLEPNSRGRMLLELRYIDRKSWDVISRKMHLSRSVCFDSRNKALENLLAFKKVRAILEQYKREKCA